MAWDGNKRTVYCHRCYEMGHNRRSCPRNSEETKERYKSGDLARRCSYCNNNNHTRRKCEKLVEDMANDVRQNSEYRTKLAAFMISSGLGIGALIKRERDGENENVYLVNEIRLEHLTHRDYNFCAIVAEDVSGQEGWSRTFSMPYQAYPDGSSIDRWSMCKIAAPVDSESVRGMFSAEWLSGKSGLDKYYQKKR